MELDRYRPALRAMFRERLESWEGAGRDFDPEEVTSLSMELVHPSIGVSFSDAIPTEKLPLGASKMGGGVDLPHGKLPPLASDKDTWLVCQIALSDLGDGPWKGIGNAGMLYLYAQGNPHLRVRHEKMPFRFLVDLWRHGSSESLDFSPQEQLYRYSFSGASRLGSSGDPAPGSISDDSPEVPLILTPILLFPSYETIRDLANEPPKKLEALAMALDQQADNWNSPLGNPALWIDAVMTVAHHCTASGIPAGDFQDLMFGDPEDMERVGIQPCDWFEGGIYQLFRWYNLDRYRDLVRSAGLGDQYSTFGMILRSETYVRRGSDGALNLNQQWSRIDWSTGE